MSLLDQLNELLLSKAKFIITNHFVERLRTRAKMSVKEFKRLYLDKLYQAIDQVGFSQSHEYTLICKDFIVIAVVETHSVKKHRIILKTCLLRTMKTSQSDYKIIIEYFMKQYGAIKPEMNEAVFGKKDGKFLLFCKDETEEGIYEDTSGIYILRVE